MYRCAITKELFPAKDMQVDHIEPVIPEKWGRKEAHKAKTKEENSRRKKK